MEYLKFLICDDEESIRKGLKFVIDWEKCGYKYCGEASNGKDAVNQIEDLRPDLVMLDIKMPGMTGLEVLSTITNDFNKKNIPVPAFVILSGFSDFEYAKTAVNNGAKAYLLKPVDEEELEKTVKQIREEILEKRALYDISENSKLLQTTQFLQNLLNKQTYDKNKIPDGDKFFEEYDSSTYQTIIFNYKFFNNSDHDQLEKYIKSNFSFFTNQLFNTNEGLVLVLKTKNQAAVINCVERTYKNYGKQTFICYGHPFDGIDGILQSYNQAKSLEKNLFYAEKKAFVSSADQKEDVVCITNEQLNDIVDKIVFCIETYNKEELENVNDELKNLLNSVAAEESETKKNIIYCLVELRNKLINKYPEREILDGQTYDIVPQILKQITYEDCLACAKQVFNDFIENFNFNTADSVIVKVIAYIKTNYASDLKLESLGDMFNCNSAYLGKKFKKYTGVQFNTYLDNLRIEEAKDKLLHTDLKIYQISKLVGYANTDYFFMKFKKSTGLTPKEFKSQAENEKE